MGSNAHESYKGEGAGLGRESLRWLYGYKDLSSQPTQLGSSQVKVAVKAVPYKAEMAMSQPPCCAVSLAGSLWG